MDYKQKMEEMKEEQRKSTGEFWKPSVGTYDVTFREEPEDSQFEFKGENILTIKCPISVKKGDSVENFIWSIGKAKSPTSCYGQIMSVGEDKGKLKGETLKVIVMTQNLSDGREVRKYTIMEAVELASKQE